MAPLLSTNQRHWIDTARARVDAGWVRDLLIRLIEIPSPYGEERAIATELAAEMKRIGMDALVQDLDPSSANAIGQIPGASGGAHLLMFAPLDTPFTGRPEDDIPWAGDSIPPHLVPVARVTGGSVTGLSAHNPKGHIVALLAAAKALIDAKVPLRGALTIGLGAGGAPVHPRPGDDRPRVGHCRGGEHMIAAGLQPDYAIVAKPGYAVAWEEVGAAWFRLRVRGTQSYVGRKHLLEYRNPIALAAPLVTALEAWFPEYTARHTDGLVAPQAAITSIHSGWPNLPAFVPAACDIGVDMRLSPRTSPDAVRAELEAEVSRIAARHPDLSVECEPVFSIPGATTAPDNWIIQSCIRAWEDAVGRPHTPYTQTSGQTEAVVLRGFGIPTARIGLPQHMGPVEETRSGPAPKHNMGAVEIESIVRLAHTLLYTLVDTLSRRKSDLGL